MTGLLSIAAALYVVTSFLNRLPPFNSLAAPHNGPPGRGLLLLAALVLAAHALLLTNAAAWFGQAAASDQADAPAKAFATRRIEPLPDPAASPIPREVPTAPIPPRATKKRFSKPSKPAAHVLIASSATNSIADEMPAPVAATPEPTPATDAVDAPPTAADAAPADTSPPNPLPIPAASAAAPPLPVTTSVTSVKLPASAVLRYEMTGSAKGLTYHAKAELGWLNEGDHYDARMTVSALFLGSRSMASVGQLGTGGLAPTRFSDKTRSEVAAHFEPDKGLITFSANTPPAPWVPGAQDRVSVFFQISGFIAASPNDFPAGTTVVMYTTGPRSADTWTFTVVGEELLYLPYGNVKAIKLQRKPQRDYDQMVEIWLAPSLDYLPVRNKITQSNGDFIDQQLTELTHP